MTFGLWLLIMMEMLSICFFEAIAAMFLQDGNYWMALLPTLCFMGIFARMALVDMQKCK